MAYASRDKTSPAKYYGTNYYPKELPEFSELLVYKTDLSVILLLSNNKAQFLQSLKTLHVIAMIVLLDFLVNCYFVVQYAAEGHD